LVKNFENKNIKYTTTNTPIKFCIDIDSIDTDKIANYIKNIDSPKSTLSQINETSTYLSKICPYFKDLKNDHIKNQLYLTYLSDLLNYKNGSIDKIYMNNWCNICNGLETIKENPNTKN
jgi:vacuolar-type H+-ATPase subunit C/Vma6